MFKWNKKGQIWAPSADKKWAKEYGQNPNALVLKDRIRIYFSSRRKSELDGKYISYIFFVDVDKNNPSQVLAVHEEPILNTEGQGEEGSFDQFGTMPGSLIFHEEKQELWLYYVGWSRSNTTPYKWANGLAISKDEGLTFEKAAAEPIISKHYEYPYLHACPRVFNFGKNNWQMWYAGGIEWFESDGVKNPIYVLMHAHSEDGLNWKLSGRQTIASVLNKECQSSASVIKFDNLYHMFFSYRDVIPNQDYHKQYRVGYASSKDLIHWERDDSKAGIDVSAAGWDSVAICYPHVVNVGEKIYMFYSGSQYGCAGFGYAELEND